MCFSCLWHLMPTDPILQYSVLNGALIIVAMTAIIIIITVLSIFGHIGIMYSIFYIKKMSKVGGLETMGKTSLRPIKALFFLLHHDVSYKHRRCWRSAWSPSSMPAAPAPCPFSSALMKRSGFWGGESWGVQSKKPVSSTGKGWSTIYYWGRVVLFFWNM